MSNYNKSTNFAVKDTLQTGDPEKLVSGAEIDNEFNAISSAITTKTDKQNGAATDNLAAFDANGNLKDSGKSTENIDAEKLGGELPDFYINFDNFGNLPPIFQLGAGGQSRERVFNSPAPSPFSPGANSEVITIPLAQGDPAYNTIFEGKDPDFVMYFMTAHEAGPGVNDIRNYTVNFGGSTTFSEDTLVMGISSDRQNSAEIDVTSTFTLPFVDNQQFLVRLTADNIPAPPVLKIYIVGFQYRLPNPLAGQANTLG